MLSRRLLLGGLAAAFGATALPRALRAAGNPAGRRFLFFYNPGGWDPLSALAPLHGAAGVDMSPLSGPATAGALRYVDSPANSVRAYFEAWHARTTLVHGVSVPSVSHEICTKLSLTGEVGAARPDWPTLIADAQADAYTVPSMVLGGPSFPGALGVSSARVGTNGQLQALLDGDIFAYSDVELPGRFRDLTGRMLDRYAAARARARADGALGGSDAVLATAAARSVTRVHDLRDASWDLNLSATYDLTGQVDTAIDLLHRGLARCVTVSSGAYGGWDTHTNNDQGQLPLHDLLFSELHRALGRLQSLPGREGGTLLDETTVVVLSEMGRTPRYNTGAGRDHWPFSSVLLAGAGATGGEIGGWDDNYFGRPIDLASGEPTETGAVLSMNVLGATLLAMAGLDPEAWMPGERPIGALLS